jgi:hypothetical protein
MMEVGGALAGQKPIYVLAEPDAADDLPTYLQRQHVLPLSKLDRLGALLEEGRKGNGTVRSRKE